MMYCVMLSGILTGILKSPYERLLKISKLYIQWWGFALALPSDPWHLMFAPGQLENLVFS